MSQAEYLPNNIYDLYKDRSEEEEYRSIKHVSPKFKFVLFLIFGVGLLVLIVMLLQYKVITISEPEENKIIAIVGGNVSVKSYEKYPIQGRKSILLKSRNDFSPKVNYERTSSGVKVAIQLPEEKSGEEIFIQSYKENPLQLRVTFRLPKVNAGQGYLVEIPKLKVNLVEIADLETKTTHGKGTKVFHFFSRLRGFFSSVNKEN